MERHDAFRLRYRIGKDGKKYTVKERSKPTKKSAKKTASKKSIEKRRTGVFDNLESLIDDLPVQEGIDFLVMLLKRCGYMCGQLKRQASQMNNDADKASDQSEEATGS
jgi:hypothetical protein